MIPRLHLVTDDVVLRAPAFPERARTVLTAFAPVIALHLRGHGLGGGELFRLAEPLVAVAGGAPVLVNDRVDVALAAHAGGAQLGRLSIPVAAARRILGGEARIGYSAHAADEAEAAAREGADFVVLGTIYATPSHPGEPGAGVERIREMAPRVNVPVIAIGGMTPQRVPEVLAAGAHGIAVLRGVWNDTDPIAAIHRYLAALEGRA